MSVLLFKPLFNDQASGNHRRLLHFLRRCLSPEFQMLTKTAVVSSAAREAMAMNSSSYLPEDIIIEILRHFSLRSLAKANCVSKLWQTHISTIPLLLHAAISSPLHHGFFFQGSTISKNGVPIHFFPSSLNILNTHFYKLIASSNGLLLCGKSNQNPIVNYSVWNPTSNRLIPIPKPRNLFTGVKIGFHSHDSVSFTILRFGNLGLEPMEIFSSETGEWRHLAFNLAMDSLFLPFEGPSAVVLNGVFYWLEFRSMIYAFDLLKNEFLKVGFPFEEPEYRREVFSRCLAVAGGEVVMASTNGEVIEIWILQDKASSLWGLKSRLNVESLVGIIANTLCARAATAAVGRRIVGIVGFQAWDSERIYLNTTEVVVCCDIGSGKVEIVHRFDESLGCTDVSDFMFLPYECVQLG
ncbi:F-box protein At1g52495-like [Cucurbita moschata]|uniref:F-box protein At1g52495-like n=2 Tax=Cucurbita TaxID=3660 RepID=A0A6J1EX93_CUCMO|nr:F-box protein At1g52495-like [Cucurbita moschata]